MIENWIQLFHIPEFYDTAYTLFHNIPIEDEKRVMQFTDNSKLVVASPLGITSNYTRLMRVKKTLSDLSVLDCIPSEVVDVLPTHMFMRGAKRIERKDSSLYYGFGSIIFLWVEEHQSELFTPSLKFRAPFNDYNFPCIVEAKHIGINFGPTGKLDNGQSSKWKTIPALKSSYICAFWSNEDGRQIRANGPSSIGFRNYREFWKDGEFKRARWDGNGFDWPLGWMKSGTTEQEIDRFIKQTKGILPRENQFFKEERDEFNYMTEFMANA